MSKERLTFSEELDMLNISDEDKQEMIKNYNLLESKKESLKSPWAAAVNGDTIIEAGNLKELEQLVNALPNGGDNAYLDQIF